MSSGSDSDEDYVPGKPEQLSEEESADEQTEKQYEGEVEQKKKRKSLTNQKNGKKRKISKNNIEPQAEENIEEDIPSNPEEEKKKEDDLWAMFLGGTSVSTKPKDQLAVKVDEPVKRTNVQLKSKKDDIKSREARIFEFAGEKVVVEDNVIKESAKEEPSSTVSAPLPDVPRVRPAGISSILDQLNRKSKLSTLEKSKLDWDTFKKKEGLQEEIQTFNRGKEGYLEKQDFLERADVRQFEIERDLRAGRRGNR